MKALQNFDLYTITVVSIFSMKCNWRSPIWAAEGTAQSGKEEEIFSRGPVHETFAWARIFNPKSKRIVPKAPPGVIEELPPSQRPDEDPVA